MGTLIYFIVSLLIFTEIGLLYRIIIYIMMTILSIIILKKEITELLAAKESILPTNDYTEKCEEGK